MKTNYKPIDKVTVKKLGILNGANGTVLSNNTETNFRPVSVIIDNGGGSWSFHYHEIESLDKAKEKAIVYPFDKIEHEIVKSVEAKTEKRKYNKRAKAQPVKEKRKYTKKSLENK